MFKTIAITTTALALTATSAAATNAFGHLDGLQENASTYEVNFVRADGPGYVSIETFSGTVLGTASVNAGTNSNVAVPLQGGIDSDVVAKLIVNGVVSDVERLQVR